MKRVCIVCEGQTEETFVRDLLSPSLGELGLIVTAEMIDTSPGHRGGALRYERVRQHLRNTLRQRSAPLVTTMFDLYRLDPGFPAFEASQGQRDLAGRLHILEQAFHTDVVAAAGCRDERFIAHIQPYEFEALLFSDIDSLTAIEAGWQPAAAALTVVRDAAASPEHINDSPQTKPAAHLALHLRNPSFHKRRHGPLAAQRMGLSKIEAECRFFAAWLGRLRALAA
jgi:hypothetical protein